MNIFRDIVEGLRSLITWWFVVEPWEQAVRVRFGKHVSVFGAGVHLRIPFLDTVYVQNTRRRVMSIGLLTLTTADSVVLTVNGGIGYRVADVLRLHQTLHNAEASVLQEILGVVASYVATRRIAACKPAEMMKAVQAELSLEKYGLADIDFFLSAYAADVPAIRLIQDGLGGYSGGGSLSTNEVTDVAAARPSFR